MRQEGDQERGDDRLVPLGADRALRPRHVDIALRGLEPARSLDGLQVAAGNTELSAWPTIAQWGFSIFETGGVTLPTRVGRIWARRGTITGPALKELRLWVSLDASRDLSPLAALEPSSPFFLGLQGTQVADAGVAHVRSLTRLQGLALNDTAISDAGLALGTG
jgi:hypothetical protein